MARMTFRLTAPRDTLSVRDLEASARRALPDMVWAYVNSGAEDLVTLTGNVDAWQSWRLPQRVLTGVDEITLATRLAGVDVDLPVLLAPTGLTGLTHWQGEVAAARAAEARGTRAVLSMAASYLPEEVVAATRQRHHFQLYPWRDEAQDPYRLVDATIDRVAGLGFTSLFVTVDTPIPGNREVERRRGIGIDPVLTPRRILDAARRPRWSLGFLRHRRVGIRLLTPNHGLRHALRAADRHAQLLSPHFDWASLEHVRRRWDGPLYVKGILDPDDALRAVDSGADGIVVSNHGGRQMDSALATGHALGPVVDAVGGRCEILVDGGIRRGADIVKALCLGADGVLIGRAYLYGLAVAGQTGVEQVLDVLATEMRRVMTFMGVADVRGLHQGLLLPPTGQGRVTPGAPV